jgi:hypothetical protein
MVRSFRKMFAGLFYITTANESIVYNILKSRVEKLWSEPITNLFGIYSNDKECYIVTRDKKMICLGGESELKVKLLTREDIQMADLSRQVEERLFSLIK